jgi:dTDP-glucose 4,6-dehydratase
MNLDGKKVLVTGADGFIGSHVVEALVRRGIEVRAMALYNTFGQWGWLEHVADDVRGRFEIFPGDVRDPFGTAEAVRGCQVVLHLAALIAIPYSYRAPSSYIDTNVSGTLNVLEAARTQNVERVVVTSTSEVYGTARFVPITEEHPLQGQSPYSASKIGADALAFSYFSSFETPVTLLRPFNTYGPRQSTRAVIPTIITQLAGGAEKIKLGAISPTRDFTFVEDTAEGFIEAAQCDAMVGQVTNIGSGFEISVGDTVRLIAELMGKSVGIETDEQRLRPAGSEVERLWASTDKARERMNWSPKHGGAEGFRIGLAKAIDWFQKPEHLAITRSGNTRFDPGLSHPDRRDRPPRRQARERRRAFARAEFLGP